MADKNECAFCDHDNLEDRIISENESATAFLSNPRLALGHTLVVPNRHLELPTELTASETAAIFALINPIHVRMLGSLGLGADIWQKTRPVVAEDGYKVDHVHFHVLPSSPGEERYSEALSWRRSLFQPLEDAERESMITLLQGEV